MDEKIYNDLLSLFKKKELTKEERATILTACIVIKKLQERVKEVEEFNERIFTTLLEKL